MIMLGTLFLLLLIGFSIKPYDNNSAYDEYCNLECWSRRKPCCKTS